MKKTLAILIPSYKRPEVLNFTLSGLQQTLKDFTDLVSGVWFDIGIYVGLNKVDWMGLKVVSQYKDNFEKIGIDFGWEVYKDNIGKAACLNDLFNKRCPAPKFNYIITLDNDMYLKKPWLHLINKKFDYDMIGFASPKFWAHIPAENDAEVIEIDGDIKTYRIPDIAGGMLLFHREFLERHPWTNLGGVYGRDDEQMCRKAEKKFVLKWEADWLEHDPLKSTTSELESYEKKKKDLYSRGITVFQKGWDE